MNSEKTEALRRWLAADKNRAIYIVGAGSVGCCLVFGGTLATTATLAGLLATASAVILITKLPRRLGDLSDLIPEWAQDADIRGWLVRNQLLVDVLVSLGAFVAMGSTGITAILAAGIAGILCSCALSLLESLEKTAVNEET